MTTNRSHLENITYEQKNKNHFSLATLPSGYENLKKSTENAEVFYPLFTKHHVREDVLTLFNKSISSFSFPITSSLSCVIFINLTFSCLSFASS